MSVEAPAAPPEDDNDDDDDEAPDLCEDLVITWVQFQRAMKVLFKPTMLGGGPDGANPPESGRLKRTSIVEVEETRRAVTDEIIKEVFDICKASETGTKEDLERAYEDFGRCANPKRVMEVSQIIQELRQKLKEEAAAAAAAAAAAEDDEEGEGELMIDFLSFVSGLSSSAATLGLELRSRLEGEMHNLKAMFTLIDLGGDGDVDVGDFVKAVELVGLQDVNVEEMTEAIFLAAGDEEACLADFVCMCCIEPETITRRFVPRMRYFLDSFTLFDEDGEGEISADGLGTAISKLFGWRPTRYEAQKMVKSVDEDDSGIIEFNEFVLMMTVTKSADLVKIKEEIEAVYSMFMMFDLDENGSLACFEFGLTEFSKVMRSTGHRGTDNELADMFSAMDEDGEGNVSFAEFTEIVTGKPTDLSEVIKVRHTELQSFFSLIDKDGGGAVDFEELLTILQLLGKLPSEADETQLLRAIDVKRDEEVGFDRFVRLLAGDTTTLQNRLTNALAEFREAFLIFDVDGGGNVNEAEFVLAMENVFGCADPQLAGKMIRQFDADGTGDIDFGEFVAMMVFTDYSQTGFDNVIETPLGQLNDLLKQQLVGYREAFNLFDDDDDGNVTAPDLIRTFKMLAIDVDDSLVYDMVNGADVDGSGELQFAEFVLVLAAARNETGGAVRLDKIAELREMWAYFDQDGSGSITEDEIAFVLVSIGTDPEAAPGIAHDMMVLVDEGEDGEIEFPEFVQIMCMVMGDEEEDQINEHNPKDAYGKLVKVLGEPVYKPVLGTAVAAKKRRNKLPQVGPMEQRTKELMQMRSDLIKLHMDGENRMARQMEKLLLKVEKQHNVMAKEVLQVLREHLGLELFKRMPDQVAIELCCHMGLQYHDPGSVLLHEGKAVDAWFVSSLHQTSC